MKDRQPGGGSTDHTDRYALVFALLLLSYLLSAFLGPIISRALVMVTTLAALLLALRPSGIRVRPARRVRWAVMAGTLGAECLVMFVRPAVARPLVGLWTASVFTVTLFVVVWGVLHHREITLQTVFGALSAYLLIGFLFSALYTVVAMWGSGPFFADGQPATTPNLQYFSFVTLTTTGYGDLVAAGSGGRSLAVLEALLGQIFLVTLVARLVALLGTARPEPGARRLAPDRPDGPDGPPGRPDSGQGASR
jgi:voltage-gated potassium channel Kch